MKKSLSKLNTSLRIKIKRYPEASKSIFYIIGGTLVMAVVISWGLFTLLHLISDTPLIISIILLAVFAIYSSILRFHDEY